MLTFLFLCFVFEKLFRVIEKFFDRGLLLANLLGVDDRLIIGWIFPLRQPRRSLLLRPLFGRSVRGGRRCRRHGR